MTKQPNPKLFLALAATALIGGSTACYFQYAQLSESEAKAASLKKQILDENGLRKKVEEGLEVVQKAESTLNHLEKGVPQFAYVPTMLRELESIGKLNGCDIYGVRPKLPKAEKTKKNSKKEGTSKKAPAYTQLDIEVTGRGRYERVLNLVSALEAFPKIVAVRAIDMTPKKTGKEGTGEVNLEFTISLRAFVFPPEPEDGPAVSPTAAASRISG
jgi:Tfp pilus assembly protein PilO